MVIRASNTIDGYEFAARTGPGEVIAFVLVIVVVVEAVVAAIELTVNWRQISGGCVDTVAFREAEDVAFKFAVGTMLVSVKAPWVEGWVGCCALRESVS